MPSLHEILLRVRGDTQPVERDLTRLAAELNTLDRERAEAEVRLDTSDFERKRRKILAQLKRLETDTTEIELEVNAATTILQLQAVEQRLKSLRREALKTRVLSGVSSRLRGIANGARETLRALRPTSVGIGRFTFSLGRLGPVAVGVAGVLVRSLKGALVAIASSGTLAASGLATLIAALGQATIAVGQLAGALAIAFVGTLLPALLLGVGTLLRFKDTADQAGTAAHRLKSIAGDVAQTFRRTLAPAADLVMTGLADGLGRLRPMIARLRPAFTAFGKEVNRALAIAAAELTSPTWERGWEALIRGARRVARPLTNIFLRLAALIRNIAIAAMPLLEDALERIAQRLKDWQEATSKIGGVRRALQRAAEEAGVFTGLFGALGRLMGTVFGAGAKHGQRLARELTAVVRNANDLLNTREGQRQLNGFWREAANHLRTWASAGAKVIDAIAALIDFAAPFGQQLVEKIGEAAEQFERWLKSEEGSERMKRFFQDVIELVETLAPIVVDLIDIFMSWTSIAAAGLRPILEMVGDIIGAVADAGRWLEQNLSGPLRGIAGIVLLVLGPVKLLKGAFWLAQRAASLLGGAIRNIRGAVTIAVGAITAVPGIVTGAWNTAKSVTQTIWNAIKAILRAAWQVIRSIVAGAVNSVRSRIVGTWNTIRSITSAAWSAVRSIVSAAINAARGAVSAGVSAIRSAAANAWQAIVDRARSLLSRLGDIVRSAFEAAKDAAISVAKTFADVGRAIVDGVVDGLGGLAGALADKLVSPIKAAADKAKSLLKIGSPSKLFASYGGAIVDGMEVGLARLPTMLDDALIGRIGDVAVSPRIRPPLAAAAAAGGAQLVMNNNFHTPAGGVADPRIAAAQLELLLRQRRLEEDLI